MPESPYISIVSCARNDGYTPNFVERLRHSLKVLTRQLETHAIPSELIVVEWNPPPERPLLADVMGSLGTPSHVSIRFIAVPPRFHEGLQGGRKRGMHMNNGPNVGIRRARGRFVTPKASDSFYSAELISRLARLDLDDQHFYRCDRHDVQLEDETWLGLPDEDLLRVLADNTVHKHERLTHSIDWKIRDLHTNACGDFMLMPAPLWAQIRGFQKDPSVICFDSDSIALHAAAAHGASETHWRDACVYKIAHGNTHGHRTATVWKDWQRRLDEYIVTRNRELAMNLRIWLDYPRRRVRGLEEILAPSIERNFVAKAARYAKGDTSFVTNDADWGLARESLPERTLVRAAWDNR